jgi:hypothetical protein
MRFNKIMVSIALLAVSVPSLGLASASFGLPQSSIHAGASTNFLIHGSSGITSGYAYYDIYANGHFVCTTSSSANTPLWNCYGSISTAGTYQITGLLRGNSSLSPNGNNAQMQLTVTP